MPITSQAAGWRHNRKASARLDALAMQEQKLDDVVPCNPYTARLLGYYVHPGADIQCRSSGLKDANTTPLGAGADAGAGAGVSKVNPRYGSHS